MKNKNESVKELERGKDYISKYVDVIMIDRKGNHGDSGFIDGRFEKNISCSKPIEWREATVEEVIEAFRKHLNHRFGEDWRTMKIKERHPGSNPHLHINDGSWDVEIYKEYDGWNVWNKNGLIYCNGIWVERLEEVEESKIHIKDAIKENTVIHCETEEEAERILGMAHELGYKWWIGKNYENNTEWRICKSTMCYDLFNGSYRDYGYSKENNYTIIPSAQIADFEEKKSTDWTPPPEDIESMNKKEKEKEIIKKYKLKKWYPSLPKSLTVGDIVSPWRIDSEYYHVPHDRNETIYKEEVENNPGFWELIEEEKTKPLFITDDGVEVFDRDTIVYNVRNNSFEKIEISAVYLNKHDFEHKVFFHKSNADKYIWQNKRVFSYEDFQRWGCLHYESEVTIRELAKKRSKE